MANVRYSGGRSATLGTKTIDENGVYNASSDELDGYSEVTVEVPEPSGNTDISIVENGTTVENVADYETATIAVNVPIPEIVTQEKTVTATTSQQIVRPDSGKYLSQVTIQPQVNNRSFIPDPDSVNDMGTYNSYRFVDTTGMVITSGDKELEYTSNGVYTDVDVKSYDTASITVNVPNTADLGTKTITINGTYEALDDLLDGYSEVTVNVPQNATLGIKNITNNGDYYASADNLDGYSRVSVNVSGGNLQSNKTVTATTSQQIVEPDTGYDGLEQVTVNPQVHTATYTPAENTAANDMGATNNYRYVNTSGMHITNMLVPSNTPPTYFNSGAHLTATGNGYAITGYTDILPSNASPVRLNSANVYRTMSSGYAIQYYDDEEPSDIDPPLITTGNIIRATANGYLYATQQSGGGSVEPDLVEEYTNVTNNSTKTITVSQLPKYITYFYTYYSTNRGGMFLILDVANNKAYRYGYWGSAFHNEDYTSGYSIYITSVSASSVTIKNSYGSAGNIAIGIYY